MQEWSYGGFRRVVSCPVCSRRMNVSAVIVLQDSTARTEFSSANGVATLAMKSYCGCPVLYPSMAAIISNPFSSSIITLFKKGSAFIREIRHAILLNPLAKIMRFLYSQLADLISVRGGNGRCTFSPPSLLVFFHCCLHWLLSEKDDLDSSYKAVSGAGFAKRCSLHTPDVRRGKSAWIKKKINIRTKIGSGYRE